MDQDWRFAYAPAEDWVRRVPGSPERTVNLPHDFRLELVRSADAPGGSSEAFYPGGVGFYEKTFQADEALCAGRVLLCVDGAYRLTSVRINRELAAVHVGGYTAFFADLTGLLKPGENHLLLTVDASLAPASRWYTGAGLYRSVSLWTGNRTSLDPWGVCVRTPDLHTVQVSASISPAQRMPTLRHTVLDASGQVVAQAHGSAGGTQFLRVPDAKPWHPDHPDLYTLRSELMHRDEVLDAQTTAFGFRTVSVSPEGLLLNGAPLKLRGGCVHHDNGPLGAKSHPDAELRKLRLLKASGFNAVRCAHNPPSEAFLDACDVLGMLVMDEAFDCWREGKKQLDDHMFFALHWEAELASMILRDRNHPSVICWSIGNEIVERSGISDGAAWSRRLADKARALDPTRPICSAVCNFFEDPAIAEMAANSLATAGAGKDFWAERSEGYLEPLDICGYNYLLHRYEKDHALFPNRVFLGTESFPLQALDNWLAVERLPYLLGDFVWTAWDYLGESGIGHSNFDGENARGLKSYPWHLAWCGDLDICGHKRPQSHYRDFVWSGRTQPYLAVQHPRRFGQEESISSWGWPELFESWNWTGWEGKPVQVTVYADGDRVELFLNGQSLGAAPCGLDRRYTATFEVPYAPGTLRAVAYRGEAELGEAVLATTGPAIGLRILPETDPAQVGPDGLLYLQIEAVDARGQRVPDARLAFSARAGEGFSLFGLGCADPQGKQDYASDRCALYEGRAQAVLRRTEASVRASLTLLPEGLPETVWTASQPECGPA